MPKPMSTISRTELVGRLVTAVRHQVAWTVLHNQAIADALGIGPTDLHCINLLDLEGAMSAGRLAELMGLTTGAVTGVLDRLEGAGMVRREPDPSDRRRVIVQLVPEGVERVRAAYTAVGAGAQEQYSRYDEAQLALLVDYAEQSAAMTRRLTTTMRSSGSAAPAAEGGGSAPLGDVRAGRLELQSSAANLRIGSDAAMPDLYQAHFERRMPRIRVHGGTVSLAFPGLWRGGPVRRGEILLNGRIPWAIEIRGGASNLDADLSGVALNGLVINGGASRVEVNLGRPQGTVPLRVRGGVSRVTIQHPRDAPVRARVAGGVSKLSIDGQSFGAVGGGTQLDGPGYETAVDRYEISVEGGASRITVQPA